MSDKEVVVKGIDCSAYAALCARGEKHLLLDVREQSEFTEGHIKNATLAPLSILELKIEELVPNKEEKIIAYCRSGGRSHVASMQLMKMGYTDVTNFEGGYLDYCEQQK